MDQRLRPGDSMISERSSEEKVAYVEGLRGGVEIALSQIERLHGAFQRGLPAEVPLSGLVVHARHNSQVIINLAVSSLKEDGK